MASGIASEEAGLLMLHRASSLEGEIAGRSALTLRFGSRRLAAGTRGHGAGFSFHKNGCSRCSPKRKPIGLQILINASASPIVVFSASTPWTQFATICSLCRVPI